MRRIGHGGAWVAVCAALAVCLCFSPPGDTRKSMVRAAVLESDSDGWRFGLLYQQPEPAADSADAAGRLDFCFSEGKTAAEALDKAAEKLPQTANYRLCDYVLLGKNGSWQTLKEYEALILKREAGRTAAYIEAGDFGCAELDEWCGEDAESPETLLEELTAAAPRAPRLYRIESEAALVLPFVAAEENKTPQLTPQGEFLSAYKRTLWSENAAQCYDFLCGLGREHRFQLETGVAELRGAGCSIGLEKDETGAKTAPTQTDQRAEEGQGQTFCVTLYCTGLTLTPKAAGDAVGGADGGGLAAGSFEENESAAKAAAEAEIAALCREVLETAWTDGADILSLRAYAVQKNGAAAAEPLDPQKNTCPKIRTGVKSILKLSAQQRHQR